MKLLLGFMAHDFNKLLVDLQSQLGFLIHVVGTIMSNIFECSLSILRGCIRHKATIKSDVTSVTGHMKSCTISWYKISKLKIL